MLATIDMSELNAEERAYPLRGNLENFIDMVSMANPIYEFRADKKCLSNDWLRNEGGESVYAKHIYKVRVFDDGELLGALECGTRYRGSLGKEDVYGVESFRISKSRGHQNKTATKDLKVALRTVKKMLVSRASDELIQHVDYNVSQSLNNLHGQALNQVRYGVNIHEEINNLIGKAYQAHLDGKTTFEMPVKLNSLTDMDEHYRRCERARHLIILNQMRVDNEGYGIQVLPDGKVVCLSYGTEKTVKKYASFDDLPSNVSEKLAMFKILNVGEAYSHLGASFENNFFFIAK